MLACCALGWSQARVVANFGALHLSGTLAKVLAQVSLPTLLSMVPFPQWVAARRQRLQTLRSASLAITAAAAITLGFVAGGKVLSPQYMLWLVPLWGPAVLELGAVSRPYALRAALCGSGAAALTTALFPYAYLPLLNPDADGHLHSLWSACATRSCWRSMACSCTASRCGAPALEPPEAARGLAPEPSTLRSTLG